VAARIACFFEKLVDNVKVIPEDRCVNWAKYSMRMSKKVRMKAKAPRIDVFWTGSFVESSGIRRRG